MRSFRRRCSPSPDPNPNPDPNPDPDPDPNPDPNQVRDWVYKLVATHRYSIFGKTEECRVPSPEFRRRFIEYRPEEEAADPVSGLSS